MNDSWFLSSWIVNPKVFQGENHKPNSLPFEAWIATTYFLIASLSLIFAVSSTISGACSYFVFDLCCFFNNLRHVQLLFLWSSLLFLPQFQALAAASSLIFAVQQCQGAWSCFLFWYLVFLPQSQAPEPASSVMFGVSSTISSACSCSLLGLCCFFNNIRRFVDFTLESMAVLLAYTPRCQIESSKHCIDTSEIEKLFEWTIDTRSLH